MNHLNKKSIVFSLLCLVLSSSIAQFSLPNRFIALESSASIANGTESVELSVELFSTIYSKMKIERVDPNNNSTTVASFPTMPSQVNYFFSDFNISLSNVYYDYVLFGDNGNGSYTYLISKRVYLQIKRSELNCVKLNHLYRKACHNCFELQFYPSFASLIKSNKVLELDIHAKSPNGTELSMGDWQVRHLSN